MTNYTQRKTKNSNKSEVVPTSQASTSQQSTVPSRNPNNRNRNQEAPKTGGTPYKKAKLDDEHYETPAGGSSLNTSQHAPKNAQPSEVVTSTSSSQPGHVQPPKRVAE